MPSHDLRQTIERVKLAATIEEVVRLRVPELKRAGTEWKACCPFHAERTPSFSVNPAKGIWHCFGACGTGGDAISFVQRFDGIEFLEALELLAGQYGIEMPKRTRGGGDTRYDGLYEALERATTLYQKKLAGPDGAAARRYLESRKLDGPTAEAFRIGYAPEHGNPLLEAARQSNFHERLLVEAGLVRRREGGEAFDFFRGRLMIPIRDAAGRVVGFGARLLPGSGREGPKYVNTPETPLFHKGRLVYGLDRALEAARRERHLVLVEGYTDVMAAHQVGLNHVVAVLGTATTEEHARLVRRTGATRVSLVFDGDEAGRRAASKALIGLLPLGAFEIDVVHLENGEDPADFLLRAGADAFRARLAAARPWFDALADGLHGLPPATLAERVDELLAVIARLPQAVHQEALVRELAARLGLSEAAVRSQWEALPQRRSAPSAGNTSGHAGGQPGAKSQSGAASAPSRANSEGNFADASTVHAPAKAPLRPAPRGTGALDRLAPDGGAGADGAAVGNSGRGVGGPDRAAQGRSARREQLLRRSFGELAGAVVLDNGLFAAYRPWLEAAGGAPTAEVGMGGVSAHGLAATAVERPSCPDPVLGELISTLVDLLETEGTGALDVVDEGALLTALADRPAASLVTRLVVHCARAESPRALADGAVRRLSAVQRELELAAVRSTSADDERLAHLDALLRARRAEHDSASNTAVLPAQRKTVPDDDVSFDDEPPF